jgi:hypothetical protein
VKARLVLVMLPVAMTVAVLFAQDNPPRASKDETADEKGELKKGGDDLPPIRELVKKEPKLESGDDPERVQKIIKRLNENMDASEERLKKKDSSEVTRKIQDDIIKDLDELIKQQSNGGGGGGGAGGASSASGKGSSGKSTSSARRSSRSKGGSQTKSGGSDTSGAADAQNDQKKDGLAKSGKGGDKVDGKSEQSAKSSPGKDGTDGDGMGGRPKPKEHKDKSTIADLFKDVWGHLPQNKRQEMDAYAKERFLQKYEAILRQYYRTISEQGRRNEGE